MIGKSIAHFEILAKIGQGGMGEVYRALDTKLDREVALKILPVETADPPRQLTHFESENIDNFAWSPDATSLAVIRRAHSWDVVLLENFR